MFLARLDRSDRPVARRVLASALALALTSGLAGCGNEGPAPEPADSGATLSRATPSPTRSAATPVPAVRRRVLAISVDAFNPRALRALGRTRAPSLYRLLDEGAATLNARGQVEQTVTLPNHTSMVTGLPISVTNGGHGVNWNVDRPRTTVRQAAGRAVSSVFTVVHQAGLSTALFSTKAKFSLFTRSWPAALDRTVIREEQDAVLTRLARRDLVDHDRAFTFLHLGLADQTGHDEGFMSPEYLAALQRIDRLVGGVLRTIDNHAALRTMVVVLTSDHGGPVGRTSHSDRTLLANYRVPFVVWGRGVTHGNLYDLNPTYTDPGTRRPGLGGAQPIRNGDVANLATSILGLDPVPGSRFDLRQRLTAR